MTAISQFTMQHIIYFYYTITGHMFLFAPAVQSLFLLCVCVFRVFAKTFDYRLPCDTCIVKIF